MTRASMKRKKEAKEKFKSSRVIEIELNSRMIVKENPFDVRTAKNLMPNGNHSSFIRLHFAGDQIKFGFFGRRLMNKIVSAIKPSFMFRLA